MNVYTLSTTTPIIARALKSCRQFLCLFVRALVNSGWFSSFQEMPSAKRPKIPTQAKPRDRPAAIVDEARVLIQRYEAGDVTALSPKKQPGVRGGIWIPNEIKYLFKSAIYYKPELKGPFRPDENAKAVRAAGWSLVTREYNIVVFYLALFLGKA